jgi:hypothetical protein
MADQRDAASVGAGAAPRPDARSGVTFEAVLERELRVVAARRELL